MRPSSSHWAVPARAFSPGRRQRLGVQEADPVSSRAGGGDPARCAGTQTVGGRWTDQTVEPPGPAGLTHLRMTPGCWLELLGGGWWCLQGGGKTLRDRNTLRQAQWGPHEVGRWELAATWGSCHPTNEVIQRSMWVEEGPQLRENGESMAGGEVSGDEGTVLPSGTHLWASCGALAGKMARRSRLLGLSMG